MRAKAEAAPTLAPTWIRGPDAARMLGVGPETLRRLADAGHIRRLALPCAHPRYNRADVEKILSQALGDEHGTE